MTRLADGGRRGQRARRDRRLVRAERVEDLGLEACGTGRRSGAAGRCAASPTMSLMLAVSWLPSSGTPRTNVTTTNVSTPPSAARPPTSTSAVATPRGTRRCLHPVHGRGEQRGQQQGDRDRDDDGRQVRPTIAEHVERGDHDEQPPAQGGGDPQDARYDVGDVTSSRAPAAGDAAHAGLRRSQGRARCRGRPHGCSLTGRHRASASPDLAAASTAKPTVRAGYPRVYPDRTSEP